MLVRIARRSRELNVARQSNAMTVGEFVHDVGALALWLFVALLIVLATAAALESLATP